MAETIVQALREYFLTCPLTTNSLLHVSQNPLLEVPYLLDAMPAAGETRQYLRGSRLRSYRFALRSAGEYDREALHDIDDTGFFEKLDAWLQHHNKTRSLPALPAGKTAQKIEALGTEHLFPIGPDAGEYRILCTLTYLEKGENDV